MEVNVINIEEIGILKVNVDSVEEIGILNLGCE